MVHGRICGVDGAKLRRGETSPRGNGVPRHGHCPYHVKLGVLTFGRFLRPFIYILNNPSWYFVGIINRMKLGEALSRQGLDPMAVPICREVELGLAAADELWGYILGCRILTLSLGPGRWILI